MVSRRNSSSVGYIPQFIVSRSFTSNILSAKLYSNTLDSKLINDVFDRFGPTPRLCIDKASDPSALAAHERDIRIAIGELTLQTPQELIYKLRKLKIDGISHSLTLIKRQNVGDVSSGPSVTITDYIRSRIAIRMRNLGSLQQVELYTFAQTPSPRGAAGLMFEAFFQQHFQRRILIDVVPMIWLTGHDGQRNRQWHTSHHPVKDQTLEISRQNVLCQIVTLDIYPSDVREYHDRDVPELTPTPDVFYIPSIHNAVAIDSFIYHGGYVYVFQFFTSEKPKINSKFMLRFTQYANFPPWSKWRVIFIIPDDVEALTCPHSRSPELQTLELFSSKVNVEDYMKVARETEGEPPNKKQKRTDGSIDR